MTAYIGTTYRETDSWQGCREAAVGYAREVSAMRPENILTNANVLVSTDDMFVTVYWRFHRFGYDESGTESQF